MTASLRVALIRGTRRLRGRAWLAMVGCALVSWSVAAAAQTFFKWTDDRGTVHFSDSPPANTKHVEERNLPHPPPAAADQIGATDGAEASAATPEQGPGRVILTGRQTSRTGPSGLHLIGRVKNVGGGEAKSVHVTITVVDSTQGTPCLREDANVEPSTLKAGESGNFDVTLDDPCLFGEPHLDIQPVWD